MEQKNIWLFKPTIQSIVYIILGIIINVAGSYLAHSLCAPFWLNSIGTIFCSCFLGALAGSIVGLTGIILCNLFHPYVWIYSISQIILSFCVSILYQKSEYQNKFQIVCTSILVTILSIFIAVPVNLWFRQGYVGNVWGMHWWICFYRKETVHYFVTF